MAPNISEHYIKREPSAIRKAQILFESRQDKSGVEVINLAIGNISLPMHPVMLSRLKEKGQSLYLLYLYLVLAQVIANIYIVFA